MFTGVAPLCGSTSPIHHGHPSSPMPWNPLSKFLYHCR